MSGSGTSAPAPWCPPAGSCLPLTASSASTSSAFVFFSMLCLQLAGVAVAAAFTAGTSDEGVKHQNAATLTSLYELAIFNPASRSRET